MARRKSEMITIHGDIIQEPENAVDIAQGAGEGGPEVAAADQAEAPESEVDLPPEPEEQGCSICAHRDSDDDTCQYCGEDLANFMPLVAEAAREPTLAESELPF